MPSATDSADPSTSNSASKSAGNSAGNSTGNSTDFEWRRLLNPHLAQIESYVPIHPSDILSERLGIPVERLIKLDANENPYGPLPCVHEALARCSDLHRYPDPEQSHLRSALARFLDVPASNILAGQGADELIDYLCRLFLSLGDRVINAPPTFGMYRFDARLAGAEVIDIPRSRDFSLDIEGIVQAAKDPRAKIVFLASPNNPSGHWLDDESLERLLALSIIVVLDEAYVEFAEQSSRAKEVEMRDNLVVLRTFSKAAGIAGLRLGYGIFPTWLMPELWKFKQPYNVSVAANAAGLASLRHIDEIEAVVERIKAERERLFESLCRIDSLEVVSGSQANFILCRVRKGDARVLKGALEERGILVRHYDSPGLDNCIRISIGRPEHNDALIEVLSMLDGGCER
ncbi:histidinol-phosphate transaminase [Thioalkalivibrio sp. HK1]|uniref:histidinol-phosphate transaminase n=1 Tax=Thioalkalivibrio sp. HK1 TaxID=1469245 RepID=UPI0009DD3C29|nr:histidinol-phosphate transaminase [Thioalkalivibrio sp. HK1]